MTVPNQKCFANQNKHHCFLRGILWIFANVPNTPTVQEEKIPGKACVVRGVNDRLPGSRDWNGRSEL